MTPGALSSARASARKLGLPATLTAREWDWTVEHFGGLCAYCAGETATVLEHFVPVRHGGGTTCGNCLPACRRCNARKHEMLPDQFAPVLGEEAVLRLRDYLRGRSTGADVGAAPSPEAMREVFGRIVVIRFSAEEWAAFCELRALLSAEHGRQFSNGDVFRQRPVLRPSDWLYMLWRAVRAR